MSYEIARKLAFNEEKLTGSFIIKVGELTMGVKLFVENGEIEKIEPDTLVSLRKAGMKFDFSQMEREFKNWAEKYSEELVKKEYFETWYNLECKDADIKGITWEHPSLEEFLKDKYFNKKTTWVVYREKKVSVIKDQIGDRWDRKTRYQISNEFTEYKRRNYATLEGAINKLKTLIDKKIEADKEKEKADKLRKEKAIKKLAKLRKLFGEDVKHSTRMKGDYRTRYLADIFYIVINGKEHEIYSNGKDLFEFAGLQELSSSQLNQILEIIRS